MKEQQHIPKDIRELQYIAPPRLVYVEQAIIGALLQSSEKDSPYSTDQILSRVMPAEFYSDSVRSLYERIHAHYVLYDSISKAVIYDKSDNMKLFRRDDLQKWQKDAAEEKPDSLITEFKDYYSKRLQHEMLVKVAKRLYDESRSSKDVFELISTEITKLSIDNETKSTSLRDVEIEIESGAGGQKLPISEPDIAEVYEHAGSQTYQTEVHVAASKHGKTSYACYRIADYANNGIKCAYFSLESSRFDLYKKIKPLLNSDEAMDNICIIDNARSSTQIASKMYEMRISQGVQFCVIDYIQLVTSDDVKYGEETPRIAESSIILTTATLQNEMLSLILAQPKKIDFNHRKGWKAMPTIDDIYGSGQIVKDAFCITAGFRPFIVPGLQWVNKFDGSFATESHRGDVVNKGSYFVRMLISREGELNLKTLQFVQDGPTLRFKMEYPYDKFNYDKPEGGAV